jgi:hypothetical protein
MIRRVKNVKVIEFSQSETNSKLFRLDCPVSTELRETMVTEVFRGFMAFAVDRYYEDCRPIFEKFADNHHIRAEKRSDLIQNLFWRRLLYNSSIELGSPAIEEYIAENHHLLSKRPILISWLRECSKSIPKFYFVGHKYNDRVLALIDILDEKILDVTIYSPNAVKPQQGEIVMGTLLPLGDGLYFPIIDFYHFDFKARDSISSCLLSHYEKHLKSSSVHEAFIHVLSSMLQIEEKILNGNYIL